MRYTTDGFIEKAKKIHEDRYDYSKSLFKTSSTKLTITCSKHGDFEQQPTEHFKGKGCWKCGREAAALANRRVNKAAQLSRQIAFTEKASAIHKNLYGYESVSYFNSITKVQISCSKHGLFWQTPANHTGLKQGCPTCKLEEIQARSIRKMQETGRTYVERLSAIHKERGLFYDYSKVNYTGALDHVTLICKEHGEFSNSARVFVHQGIGCGKCAGRHRTPKDMINLFTEIHGTRWDYSKVNSSKTSDTISIGCIKHGYFDTTVGSHLYAESGCPTCVTVISKAHHKLISLLKDLGYTETVDFIVNDRKTVFNQLTNKYLELDIYFPKLNRAIEVDGVLYHGKHKDSSLFINVDKVIARDALKDQLCFEKSIRLLRLSDINIHSSSLGLQAKVISFLTN